MTLFVDTSTGNYLSGLNLATPISPFSLPFFSYAAALPLTVYLQEPLNIYNPSQPNFTTILTSQSGGLIVQIDDGVHIDLPYTQQIAWTADPEMEQFWEGTIALNTNTGGPSNTGILGLFVEGVTQSAQVWLRIASYIGGQLGTVSAQKINILPGIPGAAVPLPAGVTPLSLQEALGLFVQIIGPPGARQIFTTQDGLHQLAQSAQPNGDGTARLDVSEIE